jgi:hypothetical protein
MDNRRNKNGNNKISQDKQNWKDNTPKLVRCSKSSLKSEMCNAKCLCEKEER